MLLMLSLFTIFKLQQRNMSGTMDWNMKSVRQYLWKHKGKVAAISAAVVATGIIVGIIVSRNNEQTKSEEEKDREEQERIQKENISNKRMMQQLLFAKRQFDLSSKQILPTLRLKISEIVDVLHTIRQIKELRMQSGSEGRTSHASDVENVLWEEIKVMSFVLWFVSIYGTCVLVPLLRVQIVMVKKHINKLQKTASSSSSLNNNDDLMADNFDPIMDRTYSHLLERGIHSLTDLVRTFVSRQLSEWTVKDTVVTYDELVSLVSKTRQFLEVETRDLISTLLIPKDYAEPRPGDADEGATALVESSVVAEENQRLSAFFAELWDVVDSPMFKSSVIEACDVCFRRQLETLRIDMFYSHTPQASRVIPTSSNSATAGGSSSSFPSLSSPPLASLLPQLKSLASALLPTEGVGYEVQDISSTTAIETLCLSILNSSSST